MIKKIIDWILGVERRSGTKWSSDEELTIMWLSDSKTDKQIARKLNRTEHAVRQMRYRIKKGE